MSQIDDELDFETLLVDKQEVPPQSGNTPSTLPEDSPEWMADELAGAEERTAVSPQRKLLVEVEGDDPLDFLSSSGIKPDRTVPDLEERWMKHHKFTLVTSV